MIVDVRTYSFKPGMMHDWVALYEKDAWPLQKKYLGTCLGWFTSVEGKHHQVVHVWQFESQADRETRRAAMLQDPAWKAFQAKVKELNAFAAQENSIMAPAAFFKQG
jgi:NIPSNAP